MRRRGEFGASPVKIVLSLAVLALMAHSAYVFLPLYIKVYDFDSECEKEANFGAPKSNEAITKALLGHAAELGLPVNKADLKVQRSNSRLTVTAVYTVPIKFLVYTHEWHVSLEKSAVLF